MTFPLEALRASIRTKQNRPLGRWRVDEIEAMYGLPFMDLMLQAQQTHRENFNANEVSSPRYCPSRPEAVRRIAATAHSRLTSTPECKLGNLMPIEAVKAAALEAKGQGATRFCMGALWRSPKARDLKRVVEMVREVKALGLETCMTLGMLDAEQAQALDEAGLDYYNHNLDSAPDFYGSVITTRTYQDRLDTLANVRQAGIKVCSGRIVGMVRHAGNELG